MKTRTSFKLLALAAGLSCPLLGWSATATTSFLVSTAVLNTCIVVATPLAFGNYDPTAASATNGTSTISVTCTSTAPYNVGLDKGGNGSSVTSRLMNLGSDTLPYALYSDSGRNTNWGNTVGTDTVSGTGSGLLQIYNVYGKIPAGATIPAGAYTDTVTVTVTY